MSDLTQLERKLHGYQVILWYVPSQACALPSSLSLSLSPSQPAQILEGWSHIPQARSFHRNSTYIQVISEADEQEQRPAGDVQEEPQPIGAKIKTGSGPVRPEGCGVSKSSVYKAYVDMCHCEGRPTLFKRAVVGKMVKRAFPDVRTKRRGPRGCVTQHYIGLRPTISCSTRHSPAQLEDRPSTSEVERNCSVAVAREPTPDTAAEPCLSPTASLHEWTQRYVDSACATAEHFDEGIGSNHRAAGYDEELVEGHDDQAPGLSGSGEWHSATIFHPSLPQVAAAQLASASRSSHSRSFSTTPSTPSSMDSTSSTTTWAPFLPSTLAAMSGGLAPAVPQPAPEQPIPLETLESLWDWKHEAPSDIEAWHPTVIDLAASLEPTTQANGTPLPTKWAGVERGWSEEVEDLDSLLAWADVITSRPHDGRQC